MPEERSYSPFSFRTTPLKILVRMLSIADFCSRKPIKSRFMKHLFPLLAVMAVLCFVSCSEEPQEELPEVAEDGLLLNDDLIAVRSADGTVSIKNAATGKVTIKDIKLDWTQRSRNDSLAVFCSDNKRGYYNMYTGEIAIPAQYRRAWVFEEGLAAVQKNGNIGFINHKGEVVIDFKYPYHGNPLTDYVFQDGHCIVADTTGKCGIIDKTGRWLIEPEYDCVNAYKEYAIVTKAGVTMQVGYDGTVMNSFVLDAVKELTYTVEERYVTKEGVVGYADRTVSTGLFAYCVGGRYGLMDSHCRRITEPLYKGIEAVNAGMFKATLLDWYSEVILDAKGQVMR